jgi:hypothetical protein
MSTVRAGTVALLTSLTLLLVADLPVHANGSKATRVRYGAVVPTGGAPGQAWTFDAELEPLLLRLATVRDRYRLVRVAIRNTSDRTLALSLTADRMEIQLAGGLRPAILDLGTHDPELWDSLPADVRTLIAYPRSVDAGEERSVFVFIPVAEPAVAPRAFRYTIASLPTGPVVIRDMTPATKR